MFVDYRHIYGSEVDFGEFNRSFDIRTIGKAFVSPNSVFDADSLRNVLQRCSRVEYISSKL
jgi:hypothetical protein